MSINVVVFFFEDFPKFYSWKTKEKIWKRRARKCHKVARLYAAHPKQGERYYLRRLLLCRPGPTSYVDLCTLPAGGTDHIPINPTNIATRFRMTCKAMGLLQDDMEWKLCIDEAHQLNSGIFSSILFWLKSNYFISCLNLLKIKKYLNN